MENPLSGVVHVRRLTMIVLTVALSVAAAPHPSGAQATAARPGGSANAGSHGPHNGNEGNGKHIKNYTAVNSPTINRGAQQISISISNRTKTQAAFCKKTRTCRNSQKMRSRHGR